MPPLAVNCLLPPCLVGSHRCDAVVFNIGVSNVGCRFSLRHPRYTVTNVRLSLLKCHSSVPETGPEKAVICSRVFVW
jgi:hypothetical protein